MRSDFKKNETGGGGRGGRYKVKRIHPEPRRHLPLLFFFFLFFPPRWSPGQQIAVQMQFRLFSFALIVLNCMEYSNCQAPSHRWRRSKRGKNTSSPQVSAAAAASRERLYNTVREFVWVTGGSGTMFLSRLYARRCTFSRAHVWTAREHGFDMASNIDNLRLFDFENTQT